MPASSLPADTFAGAAGNAQRLAKMVSPALERPSAPPTWRAAPAPLAMLPARFRAAAEVETTGPNRPFAQRPRLAVPAGPFSHLAAWRGDGLLWRIMAGIILVGPLGWLLGWLGLPSNAPEFLMTGMGRMAWRTFGGPDAMALYWLLVAPLALAATYVQRARRPLTWLAAFWWTWQSFYLLSAFGLLPFRFPAPATPW